MLIKKFKKIALISASGAALLMGTSCERTTEDAELDDTTLGDEDVTSQDVNSYEGSAVNDPDDTLDAQEPLDPAQTETGYGLQDSNTDAAAGINSPTAGNDVKVITEDSDFADNLNQHIDQRVEITGEINKKMNNYALTIDSDGAVGMDEVTVVSTGTDLSEFGEDEVVTVIGTIKNLGTAAEWSQEYGVNLDGASLGEQTAVVAIDSIRRAQ